MIHPITVADLRSAVGPLNVSSNEPRVTVCPGSASEIGQVLAIARAASVRVCTLRLAQGERGIVPPLVLSEVEAWGDAIFLDLSRMCNVLHLDETSLLVSVQTGITAAALNALLQERGLRLPPLPPASLTRTVGALLSRPRPTEASPRSGRFVSACAGVVAFTHDGTEIGTKVAPRKAVGPDFMHVFVGTEGKIGVLTAATLRIERRGETQAQATFELPTAKAAMAAARALLLHVQPRDMAVHGRALSIALDGTTQLVAAQSKFIAELVLKQNGGVVRHAPPPTERPPFERSFQIEELDDLVVDDRTLAVGWHRNGFAVYSHQPTPPAYPSPLWLELERQINHG